MGELLNVSINNTTAIVTIDNPPMNVLNVFDDDVLKELDRTFYNLSIDSNVHVIILTGAGNEAFVAGADINGFAESIGKIDIKEKMKAVHRMLLRIKHLPKPTIAVLNGLTLGGGCELVLPFDLRIAEEHVKIGLPEVKLGLFPAGGGTQFLPQIIGEAKAKELMFLGKHITAKDAESIGLINKVVPRKAGLSSAIEMANKLSEYSQQSISRMKKSINFGLNKSVDEALNYDAELLDEVFRTYDLSEGVEAFLEKRKPKFLNK